MRAVQQIILIISMPYRGGNIIFQMAQIVCHEYYKTEDGRWSVNGRNYNFIVILEGRSPNLPALLMLAYQNS